MNQYNGNDIIIVIHSRLSGVGMDYLDYLDYLFIDQKIKPAL